jgi:DNA repair exonuclease SbcCD ATPase subunit
MYLIDVELFNICQHKYQYISFDQGMTGLLGPNGSGKSNILAAVYFAITGDVSRFRHSNRQGVISQFSQPDESCGVNLFMRHHGVTLQIQRYIKPNKRELIIGNGSPIYGDKDIAAKLESWFDMPMKVLGQYVFVDQWEMFSLLNSSPTDRAKDLYRLFGIDKAETCHKLISDRMSSLEDEIPKLDVDAIRSRILSNRTRLRELENRRNEITSLIPIDYQPKFDPVIDVLNLWDKKSRLQAEMKKLSVELRCAEELRLRLQYEHDDLLDKLNKAETKFNKLNQSSIEASKTLELWSAYDQMVSNKTNLQAKLDKYNAQRDQLTTPTKPDNYLEDNLYQVQHDIVKSKLDQAKMYLTSVGSGPTCPTCHTPSDKFLDKILEARQDEQKYQKLYDILISQKKVSDFYRSSRYKFLQTKAQLDGSISFVTEQLNSQVNIPKPTVNKVELEKLQLETNEAKVKLDVLKTSFSHTDRKLSRANGSETATNDNLVACNNEIVQIAVTEDDYIAASSKIETNTRLWEERISISSDISVLKRSISDDEQSLEEASESLAKAEKITLWKKELTQVREVLHHNALPKNIAQSHLVQLEDDMNSALSDLGVDFRTHAAVDTLSFDVEFVDGRRLPATALSGGEKVVFALAWRLAVNSRFSNDIGLLCLDEPTAGLDKDRLGCLKTALEKMRHMAMSRGLQCVIITHETDLMPLFDYVIDLTPVAPLSNPTN